MNKNKLIADAREILMNPKPGSVIPDHHGVFTEFPFMKKKLTVQIIRKSAAGPARVGTGSPVLAFDTGLCTDVLTRKEVAALQEIVKQVGPVIQCWNGEGTTRVSFELDLVPEWQPGQEIDLPAEWWG